MIELALSEEKYHISITVYDGDEMISDCFRQGIETKDVIKLLEGENNGKMALLWLL